MISICPVNHHSGKEAHNLLNKLAMAIHSTILEACSHYNKRELILVFYDLYEEANFAWMQRQHLATRNMSLIRRVEEAPSLFKYLLECAILSASKCSQTIGEADLISFSSAAELFFEASYYSNILYTNDFEGGFTVTSTGELHFDYDGKMLKTQKEYLKKLELVEKKAREDYEAVEKAHITKLSEVSLKKDAIIYDQIFSTTYGIKLTVIMDIAETIADRICKKQFGVEMFTQNYLIKKISKYTAYDKAEIKTALEFLKIDPKMLSNNWSCFKQRNMPISVSRRPIVRLASGQSDKGEILFLGTIAMVKSVVFMLTDIDRGVIKIGNFAKEWESEKGPEFEDKVITILRSAGWLVLRITDAPSDVGEIDAVALEKRENIILVIEAKAPKIDLTMDRAKWHFERSNKWCQQLKPKVDWVANNTSIVIKRLGGTNATQSKVTGIVVTRVPWYVDPDLPYKVLSFEELEEYIRAHSTTK